MKCVSISLISTLFQSVCKYCLFIAECVNVIIVSIRWFYRYAKLEGNAFHSTIRLVLTLGYIMYVMCFNCFICIVCFVLCIYCILIEGVRRTLGLATHRKHRGKPITVTVHKITIFANHARYFTFFIGIKLEMHDHTSAFPQ